MQDAWTRFQDGRWWWREPVKAVVLGLTVLAVCYPYPNLLWRNVPRWRNPNALVDPDAVELQPLLEEVRGRLEGVDAGPDALKVVEKFVYEKVKYAWDWDTWGVVDYLPTVQETMAAGQEDCDGRAVVSASLLRGLGYKADLVSDMAHVWVKTDRGETMSPGTMPKFAVATDRGVHINWRALGNIPRSLAYGVAVFPLMRELIVLAVLWLLCYRSGIGWKTSLVCLVLMMDGLLLIRWSSVNFWRQADWGDRIQQWFAFVNIVAAVVIMHRARSRIRKAAAVCNRDDNE